ncbi:MAG: UDP-N-acetylmuramate--L-alanine ligase [Peptostreptococcaceae bacterium]|nr:UDP-N-acetylmuramate--L-alanine ligase [Peptostreptococcaceae bacterium]
MTDLSKIKNVHCIGIGGIGLSAIAEILIKRGYKVSGSDIKETKLIEHLEKLGAVIYYGHKAENVENADIIIYSSAVYSENPEIVRAKELNIPIRSRAEILGQLMEEYKNSIAICGTHGKTTTTSMVSLIIRDALLKPTILVGGELSDIKGNVEVGDSEYFVTEACEYMDSFLNLRPEIGVILNIDSDHLDYFKDIDHIVRSFKQFANQVKEDGVIIAFANNPFVKEATVDKSNVVTFGYGEDCNYSARNISFDDKGNSEFEVYVNNKNAGKVKLKVPGEHNILNALAAYATCDYLKIDRKTITNTLMGFKGTHRRFDIIGKTSKGFEVIDDYAHHPTEIKATLSAIGNIKHEKLWCIFQPHTYTRTLALLEEFITAFDGTDKLIISKIYAAREKNIYKISSKNLVEKIKEKYPDKDVIYMEDFDEIAKLVSDNAGPGDIVLTMGAGDVYKIGGKIMEIKA